MENFEEFLKTKCYVLNDEASKTRELSEDEVKGLVNKAISKFNENTKEAFIYLAERGANEGSSINASCFLLDFAPHISKEKLGEFLGDTDPFNQSVCAQLFSKYYFRHLRLEEGIRRLVKWVKLPQDAQKIDRILEIFGGAYSMQNFGTFRDVKTPYLLTFGILTLNTNLHDAAVPKESHLTLEQWINSNSAIDAGADIPRLYLQQIYENVLETAINHGAEAIMMTRYWMRKSKLVFKDADILLESTVSYQRK